LHYAMDGALELDRQGASAAVAACVREDYPGSSSCGYQLNYSET